MANSMYDPEYDSTFWMGTTEARWWAGAEPLWITAAQQGLKAGEGAVYIHKNWISHEEIGGQQIFYILAICFNE